MSIFSFNKNINLIFVLIYWIVEILTRLAIFYLWDYFIVSKNSLAENEYIYIIYYTISNLLSGFLVIYINCISGKKIDDQNKKRLKLIYENPISKKTKYYYFKLLFLSFLELLSSSCYFIFFISINSTSDEVSYKSSLDVIVLLDILVRYVFSICLLKIKIYKHHIWSIYAILLGFILIVPLDLLEIYLDKKVDNIKSSIYIMILACKSIFFPLEDTLIKKFLNEYYILPEYLLFSIGVIEGVLVLILTLILYFTGVLTFYVDYTTGVILSSILYIIGTFIRFFIVIKIIYLFSSQSVSFLIISQSVAGAIEDIIKFIVTEESIPFYSYISFFFGIIAIVIIVMGTLIYDEIIIVNKWGLNLNVKKGIIERDKLDLKNTILDYDYNKDSSDEESNR